jgi:regulator of protease activity HflC (stomatin/prohibitin superfamily)
MAVTTAYLHRLVRELTRRVETLETELRKHHPPTSDMAVAVHQAINARRAKRADQALAEIKTRNRAAAKAVARRRGADNRG